MEHLFDKLCEYSGQDYYPFHMPGHKRRSLTEEKTYSLDITEIDGFDNLHHPEGILKEMEDFATELYGTRQTKVLINGSTCGLLTAVSALCPYGGKILVARNCHKAVYHAIALRGLTAVYLYPEIEPDYGLNGSVRPEAVEAALQADSEIQAVLLTSPTYDGILSDISAIGQIVHAHNLPLIVDEAHGAHLPFTKGLFPESALRCGADVVIHSLHKTLPSLTQTAVLHINSERINLRNIYRYLAVYQSSSPSYILMAGIGSCLKWLSEQGASAFEEYEKRLLFWRKKYTEILESAGPIQLADVRESKEIFAQDVSKLIFCTEAGGFEKKPHSGSELYQLLLKDYHLQMELAAPSYALALTSVCDSEEGFRRLGQALKEIAKSWKEEDVKEADLRKDDIEFQGKVDCEKKDGAVFQGKAGREKINWPRPQMRWSISDAMEQAGEVVRLEEGLGRISGTSLYLYPPGIPFLLPGEEITKEVLAYIYAVKEKGLEIQGMEPENSVFVLE